MKSYVVRVLSIILPCVPEGNISPVQVMPAKDTELFPETFPHTITWSLAISRA
jgi:hypothetical protein